MTRIHTAVRHSCRLTTKRLSEQLPRESDQIVVSVIEARESIFAHLQHHDVRVLLLEVDYNRVGAAAGDIGSIKSRFPGQRVAIVGLVSGAPEPSPVLRFETGATECVRLEDLDIAALARLIEVLGERTEMLTAGDWAHGRLKLYRSTREVEIDGECTTLSAAQFDALWMLVEQHHRAIPLEELVPGGSALRAGELRNHGHLLAYRLRERLGRHRALVETVRGRGYRINREALKS